MLYYNFKNYEEFKELFGFQKHNNGNKSRKNKILLAYLKNKELLHEATTSGDFSLLHISSMVELKQLVTQEITDSGASDESLPYQVNLLGKVYKSSKYETDEYRGICEDSDYKAVRYFNKEQDQIFKMKAGKFYKSLILDTEFGRKLPQQVVTYLCEEFTQDWQSHSLRILPKHQLFVDKDFGRIYNSDHCKGDFCSCMTDKDYHYFYEYYVDASAAYLENEDSEIIARCIIFNEVTDEDGKIWRLAERQYSTDANTVLHRLLIDSLIKEGRIDGYKAIGAGCSDSRAFVDNEGSSLSDKKFSIRCTLGYGDNLSYQDSFKYLNMGLETAYNYPSSSYDEMLDSTDGQLDDDNDEYDAYHDEYVYEVTTVYYQGERTTCDSNRLSDFIYLDGEYYHEDDISECQHCGEKFVKD
ncbi:MAG: hypothetical protein SNJ29_11840, partial [Rikenellaceae bacterium]